MSRVTVIVLAAGLSKRLRSGVSKPLIKINSIPVIIYSLNAFSRHPEIDEIIVTANGSNRAKIKKLISRHGITKVKRIVLGGRRRQDSVANALKWLNGRGGLVLIHDSARPFIRKEDISKVIKEAKDSGAAILGVPVKATIKSIVSCQLSVVRKYFVKETLDRNNLWEIQTPQAFRKELILKAYKRSGKVKVTDDSMLVEKLGAQVMVVKGSYDNIKITTPEDLAVAEAIAQRFNLTTRN